MRIYTIAITLLLLSEIAVGQIYRPEGLNMPGAWNGWTNPPINNLALASVKQVTGGTVIADSGLATRVYKTVIPVGAGAGTVNAGTYEFLFTSGASSSPWGNKWAGRNVTVNTEQSYTFNDGANNTITVANGYYTANWKDIGYQGSTAAFLYTSAAPVTIDSVWGHPATTAINTAITINVKLSATKCAEELVYLRYSTNNFSTTSTLPITNFDAGTKIGTVTIPGQATPGTTVSFYVISTTVANTSWGTQNVDMLTLKYKKNGLENFSYSVQPLTSIADGNWSTPGIWNSGSVPPTAANVTINSNVTLDTDVNLSSITVNSGKTFTASDATPRTLTIAASGSISNSGTFAHGNGTVVFAGAGTVTGTVSLNNVNISNGVNFGTASTLYGTLKINTGGYTNNPPIYATGSTLQYNAGAPYDRNNEWNSTSGAGYPYHVKVSNGTTLNAGTYSPAAEKRLAGNLTVDSASTFSMNAMTANLLVGGNLLNNGHCTLSSAIGGDMQLAGNFTNNSVFSTNSRELNLTGSTLQTLATSDTATTTMNYLAITNAAGAALGTVRGGAFNIINRLRFNSGGGLLNTGTDTLVLGSAATLSGETTGRYLVGIVKTSKAVGTAADTLGGIGVTFDAGTDLGTVTVIRYSGSSAHVTSGSSSGIDRKWVISNSGSQTFVSRTMKLYWVSNDDNGKDLTTAQAYQYNGSIWVATGSVQNASSTRMVSLGVTSLSSFTVSDAANQLSGTPYTLAATALVDGMWNGTTTVQDTVTAELHLASSPYTLVTTAKAYSSNSGALSFVFYGIQNSTPYYLVLKHRNALETWSASSISFSAQSASYDFTTAASQAYGNNLKLKNSKYCLYSGDINQDGVIDFSDLLLIDNDANSALTGYHATDVNGDNVVNYLDVSACDANVVNFVGKYAPVAAKAPTAVNEVKPGKEDK